MLLRLNEVKNGRLQQLKNMKRKQQTGSTDYFSNKIKDGFLRPMNTLIVITRLLCVLKFNLLSFAYGFLDETFKNEQANYTSSHPFIKLNHFELQKGHFSWRLIS